MPLELYLFSRDAYAVLNVGGTPLSIYIIYKRVMWDATSRRFGECNLYYSEIKRSMISFNHLQGPNHQVYRT